MRPKGHITSLHNFYVGHSNPLDEEERQPLQPLTITSLPVNAPTPAAAVAKVQESMNQSSSLSPSKVTARIEAEELPLSLENNLSQLHIKKLKQLRYEHGKQQRKEQAIQLISRLQSELESMDYTE